MGLYYFDAEVMEDVLSQDSCSVSRPKGSIGRRAAGDKTDWSSWWTMYSLLIYIWILSAETMCWSSSKNTFEPQKVATGLDEQCP